MTWDIKAGCMGLPQEAAAAHLLSHFPGIPLSADSYLEQRNALQDTLWGTVKLLPGAERLVKHLRKHRIPMAVATSSSRRNFLMKSEHLSGIYSSANHGFDDSLVLCGDDLVENESRTMQGKPHPDIFLSAAREKLGFGDSIGSKEACSEEQRLVRAQGLVFEDAIPGVQAGKRAGMSGMFLYLFDLLILISEHC